jgi:Starch-binding associating with outer membrane
MKYNFFKSLLTITTGSLLLVGTGCNKLEDFGDTNLNPLGSTSPITAALLTNAEVALGGVATSIRPALYVQYIAETQYTDVSIYAEPKLDFGGTYLGPLFDLQSIINRNSDAATASAYVGSGSNANQIAVAKILKTYYIWTTTDRWGDIPNEEALLAAGNFTPKYDEQTKIYAKMLADLKSAITGFDAGLVAQGDIIYSGNVAKWKKLANTLRMMISMRLSKADPAKAASEFALAASDPAGFIATNADNFTIDFPGGAAYRHPWFDTYNGRSDYAFSKTLGDILANMGDGRRAAYGSAGAPFPYGLKREDATTIPTNYAEVLAPAFREEGSAVVIVSAAASLLAVAEGLQRGWITTTASPVYTSAKLAYDNAITASFDQWGIAGASTYLNNGSANFTTGTGGGTGIGANPFNSVVGASAVTATNLERIALQRYIALYPDGTQAWSEWRRTGVPNLKPTAYATNTAAGKQIPRRYVYGLSEYSLNPAKVAEAVARLPLGDVMNEKVWWDK